MPLPLLSLIPAIGSAIGGILNNRKGTQVKDKSTDTQTSAGSRTDTSGYGEQGQSLIAMLMPLIQRFAAQGPSVDPSSADRFANSQAMATNARAGALQDMLMGNAASRGLTYSAPANFARGMAEQFRGSALNDIEQNRFANQNQIARDNVSEQAGRFGVAQGLLRMLPQVNQTNTTGNVTGTSEGTRTGSQGSTLGNILGSASDIFTNLRNQGMFGGKDIMSPSGNSPVKVNPSLGSIAGNVPAPNIGYQIPRTPPFLPGIINNQLR